MSILNRIELSVRAGNVLRNMGTVNTLEDFMALDRATVMAQKHAGVRTWKEIQEVQQSLGRQPAVDFVDAVLSDTRDLRDELAMRAPVTWADVHDAGGWAHGVDLADANERAAVFAVMAVLRYEYADAMLEERKGEA